MKTNKVLIILVIVSISLCSCDLQLIKRVDKAERYETENALMKIKSKEGKTEEDTKPVIIPSENEEEMQSDNEETKEETMKIDDEVETSRSLEETKKVEENNQ